MLLFHVTMHSVLQQRVKYNNKQTDTICTKINIADTRAH